MIPLFNSYLRHYEEEEDGFVIKKPFVTNSYYIECRTVDDVFSAIKSLEDNHCAVPPYVMLQPKMKNNCEYKVVCWNMEAKYVALTKRGYGTAFAKGKVADLLEFANSAIRQLKQECPCAIVDGLIRVDIFETAAKKFIVNEFEGLEARYCTKRGKSEMEISDNIRAYWFSMIETCVLKHNTLRRAMRRLCSSG
jgi:predicted RNase H-like HicB family nuclease